MAAVIITILASEETIRDDEADAARISIRTTMVGVKIRQQKPCPSHLDQVTL